MCVDFEINEGGTLYCVQPCGFNAAWQGFMQDQKSYAIWHMSLFILTGCVWHWRMFHIMPHTPF